jgi:hypothetical protein
MLSVDSQPLIKSILSLESGHPVKYASIRPDLGYGLRFIAGGASGGDVGITIFDTMIRFAPPIAPNIWCWSAADRRPYKGDGRRSEASASLVGD